MDFNVIRSRLEQERKQLTKELEQLIVSSHLTERRNGSPFGKMDEEANAAADLEKRVALQSRIMDTLVQLEHALQKGEMEVLLVRWKKRPMKRQTWKNA